MEWRVMLSSIRHVWRLYSHIAPHSMTPLLLRPLSRPTLVRRCYCGERKKTEDELKLTGILQQRFPGASKIEVEDISGGCGAMYEVLVHSKEFQGMSMLKQHRVVTEALKADIREMHGIRIHTGVPKDS